MSECYLLNRARFPREKAAPNAPIVRFTLDSGIVYFSKRLCEIMGLEHGNRMNVYQDKEDPLRIGFRKTDDIDGFRVRKRHDGCCFGSVGFVKRMLTVFGKTTTALVQVCTEPDENGVYWIVRGSVDRRE